MNKTNIEYLDYTWNPLAMRCTPVSEGCKNCWHLAMAKRLEKNPLICLDERLAYGNGAPLLKHRELEAPLHLRKPSRIGVQFMGDLFHEKVIDQHIDSILRVMDKGGLKSYGHTFLILTKRPRRMADFLIKWYGCGSPIKNLMLGVSVEDQKTADERIPILLQIPAANKFISIEPMLGPVDLPWLRPCTTGIGSLPGPLYDWGNDELPWPAIQWVIVGGETGPHARPVHSDWVRSLRDQCQAAGVSFFFKSWGEWAPHKRLAREGTYTGAGLFLKPDGSLGCQGDWWEGKAQAIDKVGKKKAGRLLDGEIWEEIP